VAARAKRSKDVEEVRAYYRGILPFYELETAGRSDLKFWPRLAARWKSRRVLELGSGLGRVMREVARHAPLLAGIDISFEMLSHASQRLATRRARLLAADMRELPFSEAFDLVIAPSDPFSHLTSSADRRIALKEVARVLAPGGFFVLDALYRPDGASQRTRRVTLSSGSLTIREAWRPLSEAGLWRARYSYLWRDKDRRRDAEAEFTARAWTPRELRPFFESCGLAVEKLWGTLGGGPFRRRSRRLIVLARPARFMHGGDSHYRQE
jgi:ubiquinone/menaquinone biosynthesis C-methylase UbiE